MNNIKKIEQTALQNNEFYGMHQKFVSFTNSITNEIAAPSVALYKASVEKLGDQLKVDVSESNARIASRLNEVRVKAYVSLRCAAKALSMLKDDAKAGLGKAYYAIFTENASLHNLNQDGVSGVVLNVIASFRDHTKEELTSAGIEPWLEQLESAQEAYTNAAQNRGKDKESRVDSATILCRKDCSSKFAILMEVAHGLGASVNDAGCIDFIDQVNGEIAMRKEKLALHKALAKKKAKSKTESEGAIKTESVEADKKEETSATVTPVNSESTEVAA